MISKILFKKNLKQLYDLMYSKQLTWIDVSNYPGDFEYYFSRRNNENKLFVDIFQAEVCLLWFVYSATNTGIKLLSTSFKTTKRQKIIKFKSPLIICKTYNIPIIDVLNHVVIKII